MRLDKKTGKPGRGSGLSTTNNMGRDAQRFIEAVQPYNAGNAPTNDGLWIINDLRNIYKHRFIHVLIGAVESTLVDFEYIAEGEVPPFTAYALDEKGLIDGAVLLEAAAGVDEKVKLQAVSGQFQIAAERSRGGMFYVEPFVGGATKHVGRILFEGSKGLY